jgi:hypothetical protein
MGFGPIKKTGHYTWGFVFSFLFFDKQTNKRKKESVVLLGFWVLFNRIKSMEAITEGVNNINITNNNNNNSNSDSYKKNRIQVSNTKKPLFFYVNLAKVGFSLNP